MRHSPNGNAPVAWLATASMALVAAVAGPAAGTISSEPHAAASAAAPCQRSALRITERTARAALGRAVAGYWVRNDGRVACTPAADAAWARWLAGPDRLVSYRVTASPRGPRISVLRSKATAFVKMRLDTVASRTRTGTAPAGAQTTGYDISWPQCRSPYPPPPYWVAVIGLNDGRAFSNNPCLRDEAAWAKQSLGQHMTYLNLNSPVAANATDAAGPAGHCTPTAHRCIAYNYGYNSATRSLASAASDGASADVVWLDVESVGRCTNHYPTAAKGYWSCRRHLNAVTVQGALDAVRRAGARAGIYSTGYQWQLITGGYRSPGPPLALWTAGSTPLPTSCSGTNGFAGGVVRLRQMYPPVQYDEDETC